MSDKGEPKPILSMGRFSLMVNHTDKTYFVRIRSYDFEGAFVGGLDLHPNQIKDIYQDMMDFEKKGYRPSEDTVIPSN